MRGLFVTGTDTDVGKTYLSSLLLKSMRRDGHRVGAYKPACSGAVISSADNLPRWEDRDSLAEAIGGGYPEDWICPQCFLAPLAPPVAARHENKSVDEELLLHGMKPWRDQVDGLIVEGVGGWKCPLSESRTIAEFAAELGFPVLIVAGNKLGVINHTLLTVEAVRLAGLPVAGVILNQTSDSDDSFLRSNAQQISEFAEVSFQAVLSFEHQGDIKDANMDTKIDFWDVMETGKLFHPQLD